MYKRTKSSGVDWLEDIPEHWGLLKLKFLSKVKLSNVDKKSKDDEHEVKLCNYKDVYYNELITDDINFMIATAKPDQIRELSLVSHDVIITKDSETADDIAVPALVWETLPGIVCGYHLALIRPNEDRLLGSYLFRSFQSNGIKDQFEFSANGITRYGISKSTIENSLFLVPPLGEQNDIVNFLDQKIAQIDAVIEKKMHLIILLHEMRTSLIGHAVTKGLNPSSDMKDSGIDWLGEIPAHWEIDRMKWSVTMVKNGIWGSEEDGNNDIICVRVADFNRENSTVVVENPTFRSLTPDQKENRILRKGDLLLEKSGGGEKQPVGFVVIYEHDSPAVCSNFIARMPISEGQNSRYWNYLHRYYYFVRVNTRSIKQTTGIQNLDSYMYLSERAPYPPPKEQDAIVQYLDNKTQEIDLVIEKTQQTINLLNEYRISIISQVVSGKLDVRGEVSK